MNTEQGKNIVRWLVQVGGTWMVAHNYLTRPQADSAEDLMYQAVISLAVLGSLAWGVYSKRNEKLVETGEKAKERIEEVRS
jgi:hypothetical protein